MGNEAYPRKFFLMLLFFQGKVAIGSSHRHFKEIKSSYFFHVLCAETVFILLSWRHGRDDHIQKLVEKMVHRGIPEEFSLGTCNLYMILIKFYMIIHSFVYK